MIEFAEAITLSKQLREHVLSRRVTKVFPPSKPHKFCFFAGDSDTYDDALRGSRIVRADGFGIFAELTFDNGKKLCVNDGVNLRLVAKSDAPTAYQMLIELDDGQILVFTVAMYGGISLHDDSYDNTYYLTSKTAISPFSEGFRDHYYRVLREGKGNLSMKALLATQQRFPGIGNGTVQDILFASRLHPKRKLCTLSPEDQEVLLQSTICTLRKMTDEGGRDTERDLFGELGGYFTRMSKNTATEHCPICGGAITKESYMGGSVYYCPVCQPL